MLAWPTLERIPLFGGISVSPHALGITLGIAVGGMMLRRGVRRTGLATPREATAIAQDVVARSVLGAIVGMRLAFVLTHLDVYASDPLQVLNVAAGGMSFLGGLVGALLACTPYLRRLGIPPLPLIDAVAPGVAAGLFLGRLGDLAIGDHLGGPSGRWLAWRCTGRLYDPVAGALGSLPPVQYPTVGPAPLIGCFDVAVVPTALPDAVAALLTLATVTLVARRATRPGVIAATWVLAYAPLRMLGDIARLDPRFAGLTASQWFLLATATSAAVWLRRLPTAPPAVAHRAADHHGGDGP